MLVVLCVGTFVSWPVKSHCSALLLRYVMRTRAATQPSCDAAKNKRQPECAADSEDDCVFLRETPAPRKVRSRKARASRATLALTAHPLFKCLQVRAGRTLCNEHVARARALRPDRKHACLLAGALFRSKRRSRPHPSGRSFGAARRMAIVWHHGACHAVYASAPARCPVLLNRRLDCTGTRRVL